MEFKVNRIRDEFEEPIRVTPSTRKTVQLRDQEIKNFLWEFKMSYGYRNEALRTMKKSISSELDGIDTTYLYMYAITVTPRGRNRRHSSYKKEFQEDLKTNKSFRFGWFYPEATNTNHYHGLVLCADKNVKFVVCRGREKYVWQHEGVKNQEDWIKYICKPELTIKSDRTMIVVTKKDKKEKKQVKGM